MAKTHKFNIGDVVTDSLNEQDKGPFKVDGLNEWMQWHQMQKDGFYYNLSCMTEKGTRRFNNVEEWRLNKVVEQA